MDGRTVAITRVIEGEILIGNTVTISTILQGTTQRRTYRGLIFDIRVWANGLEYAGMVVLGQQLPVHILLEPGCEVE